MNLEDLSPAYYLCAGLIISTGLTMPWWVLALARAGGYL